MRAVRTHIKIDLECPHDYFLVRRDIENEDEKQSRYCIVLSDSTGSPVSIGNISRQRLFSLVQQAQRALLASDEERVARLYVEKAKL